MKSNQKVRVIIFPPRILRSNRKRSISRILIDFRINFVHFRSSRMERTSSCPGQVMDDVMTVSRLFGGLVGMHSLSFGEFCVFLEGF